MTRPRIALAAVLMMAVAVAPTAVAQNGGDHAMGVASSHELATRAGMAVLRDGGTAADAAFTVAAVLTIVEPWFSSVMGGGTWALHFDAESGEVVSLDGVGPAASGATTEVFREDGLAGSSGMHQALVPGAWAGWMEWLRAYGTRSLPELLEPAIRIAEEGYPVSSEMAFWLQRGREDIARWPYSRRRYMPDGSLPRAGDTIRQPAMAETLREVAAVYQGRIDSGAGRADAFQAAEDYFYRGPIAESIVAYSDEHGGLFELSDFTQFETGFVEPITVDYRGLTVYQNPPNSQGITMLMALKILEGYSFGDYEVDSPEAVHLQTEALKLAHSAKFYHVADPAFVDVPVDRLLSDANARAQRELISMSEALAWPIPDVLPRRAGVSVPGSSGGDSRAVLAGNPGFDPDLAHTTTLHVVDRYGNGAAVTTSLGAQFLIAGPSGVHINNRMRMMSFYDQVPNSIAPGKKVRHTSNPYLVLKNGELYILGGNTGVDTQPQGQVQQFISVVEFGLSPQEAVARPRFVTTAFPAGQWPFTAENELLMEPGFSEETRRWLAQRGHVFGEGGIFGTANMLVRDPGTGRLRGGADPRSSRGLALVEE